jgi:formylglycine-generating enzyme required for sulfatase activity
MRFVPPGEFVMGNMHDDCPLREVTLTKGFFISATPITQLHYFKIMNENPSDCKKFNHPVEKVSWYNAMSFCEKLSEITSKKFTLPTEAQWEYACASSMTMYYHNDLEFDWTYPVSSLSANKFGLYDFCSNVDEWCLDWYDADIYKNPDMKIDPIVRGGKMGASSSLGPCYRKRMFPHNRTSYIGFRIVLNL